MLFNSFPESVKVESTMNTFKKTVERSVGIEMPKQC